MLVSNFTARSGLIAQQQRLDVIANNIANINTVGFKQQRAEFKEMLYQTQSRVEQPQDEVNMQKGHGVLLSATSRSFVQGAMQMTGLSLDFALEGDGFFTVEDANGNIRYTRDGSFSISMEEDGNYLVTGAGYYVLDTEGERISIQDVNESEVSVSQDGTITIVKNTPATDTEPAKQERIEAGKFGIVKFINRSGLDAVSTNLYAETTNSGEPEEDTETTVLQGYSEMSNVDLPTQMVQMIRAQRALSLASRALTTADEMDGKAIQIRG